MKKQLNETAVLNELRDGSVFFRGHPSPTEPDKKEAKKKSREGTRKKRKGKEKAKKIQQSQNERPNVPTNERTDEHPLPPEERTKIRHTFDIFEDQLRALHGLQFKAVQAGKRKPLLGEMVQQALDLFLQQEEKR